MRPETTNQSDPVAGCLAFFASCIRSGEKWDDTCQQAYDRAFEALALLDRQEGLDPHLLTFCRAMQAQLEANKHRGDWKEGITGDWFDEAVTRNKSDMQRPSHGPEYRSRAAVDLANFALMYWAALNKPLPPAPAGGEKV